MDQQTYIDLTGSLPAVKLEELVHEKSLCKDTAMLSGTYQTYTVEAFQSSDTVCSKDVCLLLHWDAVQVGVPINPCL